MEYLDNILVLHKTMTHILGCVCEVFGVLLVRLRLLLHLILLPDGLEVRPLLGRPGGVFQVVGTELRMVVGDSLFCPSFFGTPSACPKEACPLVQGRVQVHLEVLQILELGSLGTD